MMNQSVSYMILGSILLYASPLPPPSEKEKKRNRKTGGRKRKKVLFIKLEKSRKGQSENIIQKYKTCTEKTPRYEQIYHISINSSIFVRGCAYIMSANRASVRKPPMLNLLCTISNCIFSVCFPVDFFHLLF